MFDVPSTFEIMRQLWNIVTYWDQYLVGFLFIGALLLFKPTRLYMLSAAVILLFI